MKSQIIPLSSKRQKRSIDRDNRDERAEKLPVAKCRELLQEPGRQLSDEAILKIRDFLYHLAAIGWEAYQQSAQQPARLISLEQPDITNNEKYTTDNEESHYLRAG